MSSSSQKKAPTLAANELGAAARSTEPDSADRMRVARSVKDSEIVPFVDVSAERLKVQFWDDLGRGWRVVVVGVVICDVYRQRDEEGMAGAHLREEGSSHWIRIGVMRTKQREPRALLERILLEINRGTLDDWRTSFAQNN